MERTAFRTLATLLLFFFFLQLQAGEIYDGEEIKPRLESMDCIVKPRYTTEVEKYIKGYFARDGYKTKLVLARTVTYFPIFEKYLNEHNMPDDLKYLAVVESALNPQAVSRVGATGLWQFMKQTGALHGLVINRNIDERSCPNRSTAAAMEYLSNAYERFGNWELAIASYNCGAGNIRRAMKRAGGSDDYWAISKYLPRETRNFVPAFLGAAYMVKFYHLHGIVPEYRHLDFQLTESELVYNEMPFETIAAIAGVPISVVETLNPAYKKNFVPATEKGHWVVLPRRTMQALRDYIQLLRPDNGSTSTLPPLPELMDEEHYSPEEYYYQTYYTSLEGDRLKGLGKAFSCSGYNLKVWNNLTTDKLSKGQELAVWFPKELTRYQPFNEKVTVLHPKNKMPKRAENILLLRSEVKPIESLELPLMPIGKYQQLPETAMPLTLTEEKLAKEKKLDLQKVMVWATEKPFFRKNKMKKKD